LTPNELAFLIIGIAIGVTTCVFAGLLRRRLRHALALRKHHIRHEEDLAEKRARHLRSRVEQATGKNGRELDVETIYAALFSENGFNEQTAEHLLNSHKEKAES